MKIFLKIIMIFIFLNTLNAGSNAKFVCSEYFSHGFMKGDITLIKHRFDELRNIYNNKTISGLTTKWFRCDSAFDQGCFKDYKYYGGAKWHEKFNIGAQENLILRINVYCGDSYYNCVMPYMMTHIIELTKWNEKTQKWEKVDKYVKEAFPQSSYQILHTPFPRYHFLTVSDSIFLQPFNQYKLRTTYNYSKINRHEYQDSIGYEVDSGASRYVYIVLNTLRPGKYRIKFKSFIWKSPITGYLCPDNTTKPYETIVLHQEKEGTPREYTEFIVHPPYHGFRATFYTGDWKNDNVHSQDYLNNTKCKRFSNCKDNSYDYFQRKNSWKDVNPNNINIKDSRTIQVKFDVYCDDSDGHECSEFDSSIFTYGIYKKQPDGSLKLVQAKSAARPCGGEPQKGYNELGCRYFYATLTNLTPGEYVIKNSFYYFYPPYGLHGTNLPVINFNIDLDKYTVADVFTVSRKDGKEFDTIDSPWTGYYYVKMSYAMSPYLPYIPLFWNDIRTTYEAPLRTYTQFLSYALRLKQKPLKEHERLVINISTNDVNYGAKPPYRTRLNDYGLRPDNIRIYYLEYWRTKPSYDFQYGVHCQDKSISYMLNDKNADMIMLLMPPKLYKHNNTLKRLIYSSPYLYYKDRITIRTGVTSIIADPCDAKFDQETLIFQDYRPDFYDVKPVFKKKGETLFSPADIVKTFSLEASPVVNIGNLKECIGMADEGYEDDFDVCGGNYYLNSKYYRKFFNSRLYNWKEPFKIQPTKGNFNKMSFDISKINIAALVVEDPNNPNKKSVFYLKDKSGYPLNGTYKSGSKYIGTKDISVALPFVTKARLVLAQEYDQYFGMKKEDYFKNFSTVYGTVCKPTNIYDFLKHPDEYNKIDENGYIYCDIPFYFRTNEDENERLGDNIINFTTGEDIIDYVGYSVSPKDIFEEYESELDSGLENIIPFSGSIDEQITANNSMLYDNKLLAIRNANYLKIKLAYKSSTNMRRNYKNDHNYHTYAIRLKFFDENKKVIDKNKDGEYLGRFVDFISPNMIKVPNYLCNLTISESDFKADKDGVVEVKGCFQYIHNNDYILKEIEDLNNKFNQRYRYNQNACSIYVDTKHFSPMADKFTTKDFGELWKQNSGYFNLYTMDEINIGSAKVNTKYNKPTTLYPWLTPANCDAVLAQINQFAPDTYKLDNDNLVKSAMFRHKIDYANAYILYAHPKLNRYRHSTKMKYFSMKLVDFIVEFNGSNPNKELNPKHKKILKLSDTRKNIANKEFVFAKTGIYFHDKKCIEKGDATRCELLDLNNLDTVYYEKDDQTRFYKIPKCDKPIIDSICYHEDVYKKIIGDTKNYSTTYLDGKIIKEKNKLYYETSNKYELIKDVIYFKMLKNIEGQDWEIDSRKHSVFHSREHSFSVIFRRNCKKEEGCLDDQ